MAGCLCRATVFFILTTSVHSQFFADFFPSFQPFATNQPTLRSIFEVTRRPGQRNYYRQTTKTTEREETTKPYANDRRSPMHPPISIDKETTDYRKRKTNSSNTGYSTTIKPKKKETTRRLINDKRTQNIQDYNYNNNNREDGKINAIGDYYTQRPNYNNNRQDYNGNNYYTTENPFNKGVKPVVTNGPPITNKPVTRRPSYGVNPRPRDEDAIAFPEDDVSPEIIIGPDEDNMSDVQKRRYIELAERKCEEYKSLGQRAVQAIPLLPSPEPVEISVGKCAPTTVPLVVGGRVVGIQEFPHMALLGWRRIQTGGYAWKCGGSLVSERFILTAAHCSFQDRDNTVVSGPPRAAQLGSSYLDDPGALVVKVAAVIRHPKYKLPRSYYDLALVRLANSVKFSEMIKPACLGTAPAVGKSIIATGWGRTEYGGDQSQELRSVSLPVWEMARCQEVLGTSRKLPDGPSPDSQLCAGEERGGKDTCQGDSGGPAQLQEGCIWRIVGVTSLGRSCGAAETPGLYAKVQRAFIASQIFGSETARNYTSDYGNNNANSGNNNGNSGNNNANYDNNNGNYGNKNGNSNGYYGDNNGNSGNSNSWNTDANYGRNNRQDSTERPSDMNFNNNRRPQSNSQDNTQTPDRNVNYNTGGRNYRDNSRDEDYYNRGRPNNNEQDYSSQATNNRPSRYTTQKPYNSDGIVFNYNNNYNSQHYDTTRKPVGNNYNEYTNNYNSQNYGSNNRDEDYNRNNNYGYNNNQSTQSQRIQGNYGDNRRSNQDTINRQWWLT